ncbi:sensor histidine kinase KdpD [Geobacter sp. AOG1]|uniref:sensor histidine kinase n=1 Tax=Geobacter sp. AOG1 TaxID=1566346 RepID=UPI001CC4F000|nr:HAMP domain-containing sensor histidine kinase [Geobacter sp. AOG1]GFE56680.1 hypothetical protein AOG1_05590 [Geobacter sp. AOG1]
MSHLHDEELIAALRERFAEKRKAIDELRYLTEKLESTNRCLQESEALKGHFLSNIRNEINNPLAAIMGLAAQLRDGSCNGERVALNGRLIYDEACELDFQLENVFTAAGLEAGREAPEPAQIDVGGIIADVIETVEHRCCEKEIRVRNALASPLPFAADPRFLRIILRNLVANAVEFSPSKGVVTIDAVADESFLQVTVEDQGPGIDIADQETVFARFRQLDEGRCRNHRGLGLGLSICRALAELSGGNIGIESTPGAGSTFKLNLPRPTADVESLMPDENLFFAAEERF